MERETKASTANPAANKASTNCRARPRTTNEIPTKTGTNIIAVAPIVLIANKTKLGNTRVAVVKSASIPAVV